MARGWVINEFGGVSRCEWGNAECWRDWGVVDGVSCGGRWEGDVPNDPAVVLRHSGSRNPSEWSVGLGFHLNGPWTSVSI